MVSTGLVKGGVFAVDFPERSEGLTFLEQLTVFVVKGRCSKMEVPFLYHVGNEGNVTFTRGACKQWSCPECALVNARKWIARIIEGVNVLSGDWFFATVTAHRRMRGERSLLNLRQNWHKLRKRMARYAVKGGLEMAYARVWEHHKDGSYHMHIINNVGVNTRWLKDNAASCGMGYQAHQDAEVNAGQVAGYVAKYMLKQSRDDTLHSFPKGARRIEVSANWVGWRVKENGDWYYAGDFESAKSKAFYMRHCGTQVNDLVLRNEEKRREKLWYEFKIGIEVD